MQDLFSFLALIITFRVYVVMSCSALSQVVIYNYVACRH
jgi:hypothetical protein